jgi:phosphomannomutase/phosphoglucomutase
MWKTGHSNIKRKIKEEKAPLAGELSGHIFFSDKHYGYDDAIYAALRFVEILSNYDNKLSVILNDIPKMFSTPEIRLDFPEDRKFQIVDDLADELKKLKSEYSLINIDGIRIENLNSWGLVRASNTQPALSMRFESNSEESLEKIKNEVLNLLEKVSGIKCKF